MGIKGYIMVFLSAISGICFAQSKNQNVIPWKFGTSYNSYLLREVHKQYKERDSLLEMALKKPEYLIQYQDSCKKRYTRILGELPGKTPLNAKIMRVIRQNGFRIEKIIFESLPNHHITSNFYIPDGTGPFPAVLLFCGHEITSKTTESYQKTARLFALNGFAVLVIDCISQGEMVQLTDSLGKSLTRGSTTEHTLLNAGSNLIGTSVAAYELWDNISSLDYLESRIEVDKNRIGCLGNSGGGTQTTYFIGFDPRIKVAAPCSFITRRERSLEIANAADGCQHIPYEGREKIEISDFLISFAPKPLLILAGMFDFVDFEGTVNVYSEVKKVYTLLNKSNQVNMFAWEDGHGITKPKREAAVTWFRRWLCNDSALVKEPAIEISEETDLFCTAKGQVNTEFSNEVTIPRYNLSKFEQYSEKRTLFTKSNPASSNPKILELLGIQLPVSKIWVEEVEEELLQNGQLRKLIIHRSGEVPVPCIYYTPNSKMSNEPVIWLNEGGKSEIAKKDSIINTLLNHGTPLLLADLRGIGETADKQEENDPKYWNKEYRNAMISLHIGRSIIGQRVIDLLSLLDFIDKQPGFNRSVKIIANGIYIPVVLHTALLDERISTIEVKNKIPTYKSFIQQPLQKDMYSYVLYGAAKYYDLPDIASMLRFKNITIIENFKNE